MAPTQDRTSPTVTEKVWGVTYTTVGRVDGQIVSWVDSRGEHAAVVTEAHRECARETGYPLPLVAAIFSAFEEEAA